MNIGRAGTPSSGPAELAAMAGTDVGTYTREREGMNAFAIEDGIVYHTYSRYARGVDGIWGMYQWLDRSPKGRNERGVWFRRHDEYGKDGSKTLLLLNDRPLYDGPTPTYDFSRRRRGQTAG
jgi:hypothetical protein